MYRKALGALVLVHMLFLAGYVCLLAGDLSQGGQEPVSAAVLDQAVIADGKSGGLGIVPCASSGQRVVGYASLERTAPTPAPEEQESGPVWVLGQEDYDILLRIVEAEAGTEDEDGKLLVANVVLNRVASDKFPDTVQKVVLQKNERVTQFSPVASGRIWKVEISQETYAAVDRALEGEDISQGALYFASRRYAKSSSMRWFDRCLTFLFAHGGHEFFR